MASLNNFQTLNPAPQEPSPYMARHGSGTQLYRYHTSERNATLQHALIAGSGKAAHWDISQQVPLAPVQPVIDPLLITGRAGPDPTYVERVSANLNDQFVATRPRTHLRESGDTAEYKQLVRGTACWQNRLRNWFYGGNNQRTVAGINTYSRYHPYLGR